MKAHDLDLDSLDGRMSEARGGSTFSEGGFMFTRRAREHGRMLDVLTFGHDSVEHPVVVQCFYSSAPDPSRHRLNREGRS